MGGQSGVGVAATAVAVRVWYHPFCPLKKTLFSHPTLFPLYLLFALLVFFFFTVVVAVSGRRRERGSWYAGE
ncbi:hypothetical protein TRSC58_07324 [Trypanosoma rangeli SC58]|uniref:Transmembrane protein n=1 Tax=Trypanosoma rangeli SC58 TaxID=429131 RepID=A0A061IVQ9_TRYRA|nr:hypothetical protein TRSC58_07324 [Trypanosoma rangeli SC58]